MTEIYVPLVGQYENIGDIVLRRELAGWLQPLGRLNVYVGRAPAAFVDALGLPANAIVDYQVGIWARRMTTQARQSRVHYVSKPGEIQLTPVGLKEHLGLLPQMAWVRARGGRVLRVGIGARNFQRIPTMIYRSTLGLSAVNLWRDGTTRDELGIGSVMPDLGFGQVGEGITVDQSQRDRLAVTVRGDRDAPTTAWVEGVREAAQRCGLELVVVTQVRRDEALGDELARQWECEHVRWGERSHLDQEEAVRREYQRSTIVLSDRLHALIMGVTEGAGAVSVVAGPTDKIARHFSAAGVPIDVVDSSGADSSSIASAIADAVDGVEGQRSAYPAVLERLAVARAEVAALIGNEP